ncbi:MAG: ABC transporter ATP-binding protein [Geminicoccaceae bacterium]
MSLLTVTGLTLSVPTARGEASIVRGIDLAIDRGQRLGLVGESGCGKSMTALALMGLQPDSARLGGSIRLDGEELLGRDEPAWCRIRGRRIAMVFQEPMTALNPVMAIGDQVAEGPLRQLGLDRAAAASRARTLLDRVGLGRVSPALYPHQLSGGQRQRVVLAMALASDPDLLIADEPTTALDVTVQAQILRLLDEIVAERGMGLLLITHDLGVVAAMTDRMAVMYAGRLVETGTTDAVFAGMAHPYTRALLAARPREVAGGAGGTALVAIPGQVGSPLEQPPGCAFAPRCARADAACLATRPMLDSVGDGHAAACLHPLAWSRAQT